MATSSQQYFRTRPKLLAILQMGGARGQLFTAEQVVYFLGKYIERNKLYDPTNKRVIRCGMDLLGEVLEVETFTVTDFKNLWKIVFPCLFPATKKELSSQRVEDQQESSSSSDPDLPWWYFIKSRSKHTDEATEVGSYTGRETVVVHDSEYDSDEECTGIEYEPIDDNSDSDATEPLSSEGEEEPNFDDIMKFQSETDDDTTTTDFSMDSDIPLEHGYVSLVEKCASMALLRKEHWTCHECHTKNAPTTGFCQRCWKLRRGWMENGLRRCQTDPVAAPEHRMHLERSLSLDVCDGRSKLSEADGNSNTDDTERTIAAVLPDFSAPKRKLSDSDERTAGKHPHLEPEASASSVSTSASSLGSNASTSSQESPGLCNICRNNPNNATIIHGNSGHQFCCYRCAKRLKKRGKSCPVCRQPIMLVIKNFIVQF